jgi:hypothetical protein
MRLLRTLAHGCIRRDATRGSSVHHLLEAVIVAVAIISWTSTTAFAQTTVIFPDTSQTTSVSLVVSEQSRITVPAGIGFAVTNVLVATVANPIAVNIDRIVLSSLTRQVRLSLRANSADFTRTSTGGGTWSASDVTWGAPAWTSATGAAGTLSSTAFNAVATCNPAASNCATTGLLFTLAPKPTVKRSGTHTLIVIWKIESIGS